MEKLEDKVEKAVIVVHGIGDQLQGNTLERLATSYVVNEKKTAVDAAHIKKSTLWLRTHVDTGEGKRDIDTFKADVLTVDHLPGVAFAEVYWADLSRIMAGIFGFLIGVWKILTGLRFVVEAAGASLVDQTKSLGARAIHLLGQIINQVLVGPLVALNALLFFVVLAASWSKESIMSQSIILALFSALFVVAIYLLAANKFLTNETKRDAIVSYFVFAAFILLARVFDSENIYIENAEFISDVFWSILSVASLLLVIVSAYTYITNKEARPSLTIACAGPCLSVGLWALALSNIWIVGLDNILPEVATSEAAFEAATSEAVNEDAATPSPEAAVAKGGETETEDGKSEKEEEGLVFKLFPLLSILWGAILLFGGALLWVFIRRNTIAKEENRVPDEQWRLIFSPWAALVIVAVVVLWFFATLDTWFHIFGDPEGEGKVIQSWTKNNLGLVAVIIGILGFFAGTISRALDLLLDIITYFQRDAALVLSRPFGVDGSASVSSDDGEPRAGDQADPPGTSLLRRQQIADRFRCLVNYMVRQQGVKELTVLAHSQGTITAIEQLQTIDQWLGTSKIPPIQLITIGSPYTHVYQNYFSNQFGAPGPKHVTKWINVYTVNDYVGTRIDDGAREGTVPKNIEREAEAKERNLGSLQPIGHNGYWTDEVVMQIIKDETPF